MEKITQGPTIKQNDKHALFSLSIHWRSVMNMSQSEPRVLQDFNALRLVDEVADSLDNVLNGKWCDYRDTLTGLREAPSFQDFTNWIERRASIARYKINKSSYLPKRSQSEAVSASAPAQPRPQTQFKYKLSPGGDREFRETLRQRQYSSSTSSRFSSPARGRESRDSTLKRNMPQNLLNYKNTRLRMTSPLNTSLPIDPLGKIMELKCAWCSHLNRMRKHTIKDCRNLQNANEEHKRNVIYRNGISQNCLMSDRPRSLECNEPQRLCPECNRPHNKILGYHPERKISLRQQSPWQFGPQRSNCVQGRLLFTKNFRRTCLALLQYSKTS